MNCPICKQPTLQATTLAQAIPAHHCKICGGIFISFNAYWKWRQKHPENENASAPVVVPPEAVERKQAKICPECGHLLIPYKILPGVQFLLDHCGNCNGVWFDGNEWAVLEKHQLYGRLNEFFTQPWQRNIRQQESRARMEGLYRQRFGEEDYARLKEIKAWLEARPNKAALLAYLQSEDPYEA